MKNLASWACTPEVAQDFSPRVNVTQLTTQGLSVYFPFRHAEYQNDAHKDQGLTKLTVSQLPQGH